ncbi:M28 family metallopeptidase [Allokutzneria multivorans]|uniref:M28 family metallopeptidase n=1 Tax=Allokutzneria multivorans TaxID=1142134 RepID=A0ABP7RD44_9PSEU
MRSPRTALRTSLLATAVCAGLAISSASAGAIPGPSAPGGEIDGPALAKQLDRKVTVENVHRHLRALQRIADANGGSRAAGTKGYDASIDYVAGKLRASGFDVATPTFTYDHEIIDAGTVDAGGVKAAADPLEFSPNTAVGGVSGPLVVVPEDGSPGCETSDFAGLPVSRAVVLIRRGACSFAQKQLNAAGLGAKAVIISDNSDTGPEGWTLGDAASAKVPTGGVTKAEGTALAAKAGAATAVDLRVHIEARPSRNIIAQTRTGRVDNVVMAGSHLDSVDGGAGINDNGSGSAALLETALQLGGTAKVKNAVRFAWWGAEELGLVGSTKYVQGLTFEQQLDIALYLNFDMVGSPNAAYFVYDGDDSDKTGAGAGPYGSAQIEKTFVDYFAKRGVPSEGTDFSGRSDYGEFIKVGIPAGGLFTGAEGIMTAAQAEKWGGQAGVAYDKCYHQACDNLGNINQAALNRNSGAIAWSVGAYATSTEDVNGVPSRAARKNARLAALRSAPGLKLAKHTHDHITA